LSALNAHHCTPRGMSLQQNRGFQRNWVHSFRSHENLTIPVLPVLRVQSRFVLETLR